MTLVSKGFDNLQFSKRLFIFTVIVFLIILPALINSLTTAGTPPAL